MRHYTGINAQRRPYLQVSTMKKYKLTLLLHLNANLHDANTPKNCSVKAPNGYWGSKHKA